MDNVKTELKKKFLAYIVQCLQVRSSKIMGMPCFCFICHIVQRKPVIILNLSCFLILCKNKTLQNPSKFATFIFLEAHNTESEAHGRLGICGRADTGALMNGEPTFYCFLTKCFCYKSYVTTTSKDNNDLSWTLPTQACLSEP